jgi:APA family basic amino acid/polyamine antiporter
MPLSRSISSPQIILYGVGVIVGAGIYALIGTAAGIAGPALWMAFILAGIIAALTALSYAELGSRFPKEGAESVYISKIFNRQMLAFFVGIVAISTMLFSTAAIAWGFATYFKLFSALPPAFAAVGLIVACSIINYFGIKNSMKINAVFTIITVTGLLIVIISGIPYVGSQNLLAGINGETGLALFPAIFAGAALVFFAFLGFEEITKRLFPVR